MTTAVEQCLINQALSIILRNKSAWQFGPKPDTRVTQPMNPSFLSTKIPFLISQVDIIFYLKTQI